MKTEIKERIIQLNNGEIPNGYKKTDFGVFPVDWNLITLKDVAKNTGDYGLNAPACAFNISLPKYIRITDIGEDGNYIDTGACVNYEDVASQYTLNDGDIVFARTGASVGKTYLYKKGDGNLLFAGFLIRFSIDEQIAHPHVVYKNCNTKHYWDWISKVSSRSGQPGVNAEEYCKYSFYIPEKKEQTKIAEILMKWDEAIELQQKYLNALRVRKKYLIRELFTPENDWNRVKLGDIAEMYAGGTPSTKMSEYWGGNIPWIQSGLVQNNYIDIGNIDGRITEQGLKKSSTAWIKNNSVLVAITGATCANVAYLKCDATANQSVISITTSSANTLFLFFLLQNARNKLLSLQNGSAQGGLTLKYLQNFDILLPDLAEQNRIANILLCADSEIDLQKENIIRLKEQRKTLQQYLLNGIVRVNK